MSFTPWIAALAAASALGAMAQTRSSDSLAPQNQGIVTAEAQRPDAAASRDIDFLTDALRTALAEARMGELAAERGGDARVREFARAGQLESLYAEIRFEKPYAAYQHDHTGLEHPQGDKAKYLAAYARALDAMIEGGFVLPEDRAAMLETAEANWPAA